MEMINDEGGGSNFFSFHISMCHKIIIHQPQEISSIDLFTNPFLHTLTFSLSKINKSSA